MNFLLGLLVLLAVLLWLDDRRKERANVRKQLEEAAKRSAKRQAELEGRFRQTDRDAFKRKEFRR